MSLTKVTYSMINGAPAVNVKDFGAKGDGVTDDAAAITAADDYAAARRLPVFFPPGSYRIKSTITRKAQSAWFGPAQQMLGNIRNEVELFGTVEDIGNGNPMIRCAPVGVLTGEPCVSFENLQFVSNKAIPSLSTTDSSGITLVDISHIKSGLFFTACAFKFAAYGVRQSVGDPYLDKTTFDRCNFNSLYLPIWCCPTAGLSLANCLIYENVNWIETKGIAGARAAGADVFLNACSFQNSTYSIERCGVTAAAIVAINCWFEGGNRWIRPTYYARAEGCHFSEAISSGGAFTRFSFEPNDITVSQVTMMSIGNRVGTNTRLFDLSDIDNTKVSITCIGNYNGANFSDAANIVTKLTAGIDYEGYGNAQTAWNVSQHNRKMAIGTKRNPEQQVDVQNDGDGSGVFTRITDRATANAMAGIILDRSAIVGANDYRVTANTVGEFEIASATDGATWTPRVRVGSSWQWEPGADDTQKLGSASFKWSEVFAGSGTINTSDVNAKQDIRDISEAEKAVAIAIKGKLKAFRFKNAVQSKGENARIHFGVIAQDVAEEFAKQGLDAERYGLFCKDIVWQKDGVNVSCDEFGNYPEGAISKEQFGVRYDELFAFIIASM